ncbi:MAG: 50S ribosomal protein L10 [Deltaproteobacteria bacterium]|nr:50S ribosomal protein L10 [Deltaproteobacteria bacterium]
MKREEKQAFISELKEKFESSSCALLADYRGLTVSQLSQMRSKVRQHDGVLQVVKNRLAKLACRNTQFETVVDDFKGPTLVGFIKKDPIPLARTFYDVIQEEDSKLKLKSGVLQGKKIGFAELQELAQCPSREVLLAQFLSALQGPIRSFVQVLGGVPRSFVQVLRAVEDKKKQEGK